MTGLNNYELRITNYELQITNYEFLSEEFGEWVKGRMGEGENG